MARLSQAVGNVSIPGAAASFRIRWPGKTGRDLSSTIGVKFGAAVVGSETFQTTGVSGGSGSVTAHNGFGCINAKSAAGNGIVFGLLDIAPVLERSGGPLTLETACFEHRATLAFDNPAGAVASDCGLQLCSGNQTQFIGSTAGGAAIQCTGPQTLHLQMRAVNAGGLTKDVALTLPNGFDITQWHTYAIRIIGGSNTTDPVLYVLVDGTVASPKIPVTAAAGFFPAYNAGTPGYQAALANVSNGVVPNLYCVEQVWTLAQSEAGLV